MADDWGAAGAADDWAVKSDSSSFSPGKFGRGRSDSESSSGSSDSSGGIDPAVKAKAASVYSKSHAFGSTPHDKALDLIKNMGYKNRPKTVPKLQNALKPVLTAVVYTPLDVALEYLKKEHPDIVDNQFAVALEHLSYKRLSDVEKEVFDVAVAEGKKISKTCPVQFVPPWSSAAKPAVEALEKWVQENGAEDVRANMSPVIKKSVTVGAAHPLMILHNLVHCEILSADDQFEQFQVRSNHCDADVLEWLKKFPKKYVKECKKIVREMMQGLKSVKDAVLGLDFYTDGRSVNSYILRLLRPECVPTLLHLLSLTKKTPNRVFQRDELMAEIDKFATVVYATTPGKYLGIKMRDPEGPLFGKVQRSPSQKPKMESYDPPLKVSSFKTPQFVSLRYKELFPSARNPGSGYNNVRKVRHDKNLTLDTNFSYICESRVRYLSQKRNAPVIVGRADYHKQHARKLVEFLRSKATTENRVQVGGCEMILTGMSRSDFLRTAMRCCISVEQLSAEGLVCSLQAGRQLDVGENGTIQYWF